METINKYTLEKNILYHLSCRISILSREKNIMKLFYLDNNTESNSNVIELETIFNINSSKNVITVKYHDISLNDNNSKRTYDTVIAKLITGIQYKFDIYITLSDIDTDGLIRMFINDKVCSERRCKNIPTYIDSAIVRFSHDNLTIHDISLKNTENDM
jgi:hypothetical protein